jgi:hypothetical protein
MYKYFIVNIYFLINFIVNKYIVSKRKISLKSWKKKCIELPWFFQKLVLIYIVVYEILLAQIWIYGVGEFHMQKRKQFYPTKWKALHQNYQYIHSKHTQTFTTKWCELALTSIYKW